MSIINPKWSLENEAAKLDSLAVREAERRHLRIAGARRYREQTVPCCLMRADEPTGEEASMTRHEMKLANTRLEKAFLKKLDSKKGPKPRLEFWKIKTRTAPPVEEKKLWEP